MKNGGVTVYKKNNKPRKKILFLGENGMVYLLKLNLKAAKHINYYKLENNFIIKNLLK